MKNGTLKFLSLLLLLLFTTIPAVVAGQENDTTFVPSDSLSEKQSRDEELDAPVYYKAETITLSDSGNVIELVGHASMHYQNMVLEAAYIRLNQKEKMLYASGLPDSIAPDGTPVVIGKPVFREKGEEPIYGDNIEYNFSTQRGRVIMGKTEMEPGFYRGRFIHRIADSTMLVRDGIFTSCEYIDDPHYYFRSERIRIKLKDKIIARPITFYIADIPLAWFPFAIFPNKRGRRSGLVIPKYGEGSTTGRFLRGFGYYWAPNDYFDARFLLDFYDRIGFSYRSYLRYKVRYRLNGSLSGEYFPRDPATGQRRERWRWSFSHNQNIDPTLNLRGQGSFSSDRQFAQQLSPDINDRLNQNITSQLTLSKRFPGNRTLTISASRNENLQTGESSYILPSASMTFPQMNLYEALSGHKVGGVRSWYQNIYMAYNTQMIHKGATRISSDSIRSKESSQGLRHTFSVSGSFRWFRYFNLQPSISFKEDWADRIISARYDAQNQEIIEAEKSQFAARHTFSSSLALKTTLYGLFEPNLGRLKYIRHKMDPSLSISYAPDFSDPKYGYFTRIDTGGSVIKIDKFKKFPYGATPTSRSQYLTLSLNNLFQGKWIDAEGNEKKIDLLTANFSTSYNMLADSLNWGDIRGNFRTRILGKQISVNTTSTLYRLNENNKKINRFSSFPLLLRLSTSYSLTLNEKTFAGKADEKAKKKVAESSETDEDLLWRIEGSDDMDQTKRIDLPWSISFNVSYSYNRLQDKDNRHNFGLSSRAQLRPSKNWKITWQAFFDVRERKISSQNFSIYRDLHCWEMSFNWQPLIGYYRFQINIKASALQDIKITKRPSRSVRYSGGYY